jgi:hypothetical protein
MVAACLKPGAEFGVFHFKKRERVSVAPGGVLKPFERFREVPVPGLRVESRENLVLLALHAIDPLARSDEKLTPSALPRPFEKLTRVSIYRRVESREGLDEFVHW